jgi:hypothetical protein
VGTRRCPLAFITPFLLRASCIAVTTPLFFLVTVTTTASLPLDRTWTRHLSSLWHITSHNRPGVDTPAATTRSTIDSAGTNFLLEIPSLFRFHFRSSEILPFAVVAPRAAFSAPRITVTRPRHLDRCPSSQSGSEPTPRQPPSARPNKAPPGFLSSPTNSISPALSAGLDRDQSYRLVVLRSEIVVVVELDRSGRGRTVADLVRN